MIGGQFGLRGTETGSEDTADQTFQEGLQMKAPR